MTNPCYVDVHVLQTVPPSSMNRDDLGSPKQAIYGGVRRARVSSQAWKRATRKAFEERVDPKELATRTKRVPQMLVRRLVDNTHLDEDTATRIVTVLFEDIKVDAKRETEYLLFLGREQIEQMAVAIGARSEQIAALEGSELKQALAGLSVRNQLANRHPIDVALFGRMVANLAELNVDAAVQVAHALSTHAVETEFDYYTAVDDENERGETGAGMIGTIEFNSATYYRFATLGLHQLLENVDGDVEAALRALDIFLDCFVRSMPTGHQNSFAHRTLPDLVAVMLRNDQPINLVSAFERPVDAGASKGRARGSIAAVSAERLVGELNRVVAMWGLRPAAVAATYAGPSEDEEFLSAADGVFGPSIGFDHVLEVIGRASREALGVA